MEAGDHDDDIVCEDEINVDLKGIDARIVSFGDRPDFISRIEVEALLMERHRLLNDPSSIHNTIHPKIVERYGSDSCVLLMCIAELRDREIPYPIKIMCGGTALTIHKDLEVYPEILDVIVASTKNGNVSYDSMEDVLNDEIHSETMLVENAISEVNAVRKNMVRNPFR